MNPNLNLYFLNRNYLMIQLDYQLYQKLGPFYS